MKRTLQFRLIATVLSIVLLSYILLITIFYLTTKNEFMRSLELDAKNHVEYHAQQLGSWLVKQLGIVETIAATEISSKGTSSEKLSYYAKEVARSKGEFYSIAFSDPLGNLQLSESVMINISSESTFGSVLKGNSEISNPFPAKEDPSKLIVTMEAPVRDAQNQVIGLISGASFINTVFNKNVNFSLSDSSIIQIYQNDGLLIYDPDPKKVLKSNVIKDGEPDAIEAFQQSLKDKNGLVYFERDGEEQLLVYSKVPNTQWIFSTSVPIAELTGTITENTVRSLLSGLLTLLLVGLLLFWMLRAMLEPLSKVSKNAAQIAEGDLRLSSKNFETDRDDEIGETFQAFRGMTNKLSDLIRSVKGSNERLLESFGEIYKHSNEIYEQAKSVSVASDEIANGNYKTANSLEVMSTNSHTIVSRLQSTNQSVEAMCEMVYETRERFGDVSRAMNNLATYSDQIESFIEMIRDITEQINLLSLNASIEAARAGEYGLGFVVVADEVRKLAAQSAETTKHIRTNMKEIQHQIEFAKNKTEIVMARFSDQTKSLDDVLKNSEKMRENVDEIHNEIISVSSSSTETAASTEEMTATLREIEFNISKFMSRLAQLDDVVSEVREQSDVFQLDQAQESIQRG